MLCKIFHNIRLPATSTSSELHTYGTSTSIVMGAGCPCLVSSASNRRPALRTCLTRSKLGRPADAAVPPSRLVPLVELEEATQAAVPRRSASSPTSGRSPPTRVPARWPAVRHGMLEGAAADCEGIFTASETIWVANSVCALDCLLCGRGDCIRRRVAV